MNTKKLDKKQPKHLIVLAPHVDDEVIGCFRALTSQEYLTKTVYYFYEVDSQRKHEAQVVSNHLEFTPRFPESLQQAKEQILALISENSKAGVSTDILVPARYDEHEHHKAVNIAFRSLATGFYSVDQSRGKTLLTYEQQVKKKAALDRYVSQQKLLRSNDHFHLFESTFNQDYTELTTVSVMNLFSKSIWTVTLSNVSRNEVRCISDTVSSWGGPPKKLFELFLRSYEGYVELTHTIGSSITVTLRS